MTLYARFEAGSRRDTRQLDGATAGGSCPHSPVFPDIDPLPGPVASHSTPAHASQLIQRSGASAQQPPAIYSTNKRARDNSNDASET
ncbi:hypothetical protein IAU59_006932 [Kwoniella sp. CBS 9459]